MTKSDVARRDQGADDDTAARENFKRRVEAFKDELAKRADEMAKVVPVHIGAEKFGRILNTAVMKDEKLIMADRRSLWLAAMACAADGLVPDGREAALVRFWNKELKREVVQYFPMVYGIIKRITQAGAVSVITAHVVYAGDSYRVWTDDAGDHVEFEPALDHDTETVRGVFAMAKLKDGSVIVESMSAAEVEKVRAVSRTKSDGPWTSWWGEMARKTAIRRLGKRLPMSADIERIIRNVDQYYDFDKQAPALPKPAPRANLIGRLDKIAEPSTSRSAETTPARSRHDSDQDGDDNRRPSQERVSAKHAKDEAARDDGEDDRGAPSQGADDNAPAQDAGHARGSEPSIQEAYELGLEAGGNGMSKRAMPARYREKGFASEAASWEEGWNDGQKARG